MTRLHEQGRKLGATHVITGNEHANVAVRGLNTRLGYRRLHGEVRVQQQIGDPTRLTQTLIAGARTR